MDKILYCILLLMSIILLLAQQEVELIKQEAHTKMHQSS